VLLDQDPREQLNFRVVRTRRGGDASGQGASLRGPGAFLVLAIAMACEASHLPFVHRGVAVMLPLPEFILLVIREGLREGTCGQRRREK